MTKRIAELGVLVGLCPSPLIKDLRAQIPAVNGQWSAPFQHDVSTNFTNLPITPGVGQTVFNAIHLGLIPLDTSATSTNLRGWVFAMDLTQEQPTNPAWQRFSLINPYSNPPQFINLEMRLPGPNRRTGQSVVPGDIFCSGHVWTREGKLFLAGGTIYPDTAQFPNDKIDGAKLVFEWDPALWQQQQTGTLPGHGWTQLADLAQGRYYPSVVVGHTVGQTDRYYICGGGELGRNYPNFPQTYECYVRQPLSGSIVFEGTATSRLYDGPDQTSTSSLPLESGTFYWYSRLHLLTTGQYFMAGFAQNGSKALHNPAQNATNWLTNVGSATNNSVYYHFGSSVLLPIDLQAVPVIADRVLRVGGGLSYGPSEFASGGHTGVVQYLSNVETCDANPSGSSSWTAGPPLLQPRMFPTAVLLPDGSIFVSCGQQSANQLNTKSELLIGSTRISTPPMDPRGYHGEAILLVDGRVLVSGGNDRISDYQIYSPPYLFRGTRPAITSTLPTMSYTQTNLQLTFDFPPGDEGTDYIADVVLMRPGSITHNSDFEQRMVKLKQSSIPSPPYNTMQFDAPTTPDQAPPGYYMLFLVSASGIPSVATWVLLT